MRSGLWFIVLGLGLAFLAVFGSARMVDHGEYVAAAICGAVVAVQSLAALAEGCWRIRHGDGRP